MVEARDLTSPSSVNALDSPRLPRANCFERHDPAARQPSHVGDVLGTLIEPTARPFPDAALIRTFPAL
jgi:hypothetical protein